MVRESGRSEPAGKSSEIELATRSIKVERKMFHFDLKTNPRGDYLKITEESSGKRDVIIIPASGINLFQSSITEVLNESEIEPDLPEDPGSSASPQES